MLDAHGSEGKRKADDEEFMSTYCCFFEARNTAEQNYYFTICYWTDIVICLSKLKGEKKKKKTCLKFRKG